MFRALALIAMLGNIGALAQTSAPADWDAGFVKTNGEWVTIGNILVETNSPLNTDEFKHFKWRDEWLMRGLNSKATNRLDQFVAGAWLLARDYPNRANGFQSLSMALEAYDIEGLPQKARSLAQQLVKSAAPADIQQFARGFINRLDLRNRPIDLKFTAVDGREVEVAKMRGKVILVDFWATWCGPCKRELPAIQSAYDRFHGLGLEIIGISCDTDKDKLIRFTQEQALPWPEYFDGHRQMGNQLAQTFGVDGVPHMFLLDKQGVLRFDNVRADAKYQPAGDTTSMAEKISKLLAEPIPAP